MITKVSILKFKNLQELELDLSDINILIGGNNSGKSSALQAIQFATSLLQTMSLESRLTFSNSWSSKTLSPEQIIYSPIKDIYLLIYGNEPLREGAGREIHIELEDITDNVTTTAAIRIRKGRNKNISVSYKGDALCSKMANNDQIFSMYVPGLAGVPFSEEYRSIGAVRRAAARGDCNTILRNVLYHMYEIKNKKNNFLEDINIIFPNIQISIEARLENDGIIDVFVNDGIHKKPVDSMGTGVLQAIQICAYMNYFEPQVLLLDEPDSHLHPSNQKMLSQMILQLSKRRKNILIATHSRHLVSSLRKEATIFLMKGGAKKSSDYNDYDILMEIGALDDYDVFRDPNIKYVIATEDTKIESNQMLELILQSSGMCQNSYHILPYAGCSKVDSAIYVSKCLKEFRQDLKIIIHRDRDGMTLQEGIEFADKIKESGNSFGFITQYNDIEVYFCTPAHIQSILQQKGIDNSIEVSENIFNDALSGILAESKKKYLNRKLDSMRAQGRGAIALEASTYFDENILQCVNGHLLSGAVVAKLHKDYHISKLDLISYSEALGDSSLRNYVLS